MAVRLSALGHTCTILIVCGVFFFFKFAKSCLLIISILLRDESCSISSRSFDTVIVSFCLNLPAFGDIGSRQPGINEIGSSHSSAFVKP